MADYVKKTWIEAATHPDLVISEVSEIRPGVHMRGLFAKRDFRAGEFLLAWNGVTVWANAYDDARAARRIPNEYDVSRYEISYQSQSEKRTSPKLITCPPLQANDGLPLLPEQIEALDDPSMRKYACAAVFINEPSPGIRAHLVHRRGKTLDAKLATYTRDTRAGEKANVCLRKHVQGGSDDVWGVVLFAAKKINRGDELTWNYNEGADAKTEYRRGGLVDVNYETCTASAGVSYAVGEPAPTNCAGVAVHNLRFLGERPTIVNILDDPMAFVVPGASEDDLRRARCRTKANDEMLLAEETKRRKEQKKAEGGRMPRDAFAGHDNAGAFRTDREHVVRRVHDLLALMQPLIAKMKKKEGQASLTLSLMLLLRDTFERALSALLEDGPALVLPEGAFPRVQLWKWLLQMQGKVVGTVREALEGKSRRAMPAFLQDRLDPGRLAGMHHDDHGEAETVETWAAADDVASRTYAKRFFASVEELRARVLFTRLHHARTFLCELPATLGATPSARAQGRLERGVAGQATLTPAARVMLTDALTLLTLYKASDLPCAAALVRSMSETRTAPPPVERSRSTQARITYRETTPPGPLAAAAAAADDQISVVRVPRAARKKLSYNCGEGRRYTLILGLDMTDPAELGCTFACHRNDAHDHREITGRIQLSDVDVQAMHRAERRIAEEDAVVGERATSSTLALLRNDVLGLFDHPAYDSNADARADPAHSSQLRAQLIQWLTDAWRRRGLKPCPSPTRLVFNNLANDLLFDLMR
jgi:hypothetical protein